MDTDSLRFLGSDVAQVAEGEGVIGFMRGHDLQQIPPERQIIRLFRQQSQLAPES